MKKENITEKMAKFKLKEGIILKPYGVNSKIDNTNLTDGIAELLIKNGKAKKTDFIEEKETTKNKKDGNSK